MKKIFILIVIICCASINLKAQNLVSNGNFENWTYVKKNISGGDSLVMPDSWARGAGSVGTNYLLANDPAQGNVLQLVDALGTSGARRFNTTADFSILTEGTYRVSFKVKGNVGLRALILVKGATGGSYTGGAPGTSIQTATNHFTIISDYPSGTNVADWTTLKYDITVPSTATFGTDYRLHISWSSSSTTKPACDFLIDDIKFQKLSDEGLSAINITPLNYTTSSGTPSFALLNFSTEVLNYTFTSSYLEVPVVDALPANSSSTVVITQPTSLTGSLAERTATIAVTTSTNKTTTYTVEFVKHPGFISGIPWDVRGSKPIEWGEINGMYSRNSTAGINHGTIPSFGNTSIKCLTSSETGYYMTTPVLVNGASTLKFYLKNTDIVNDNTPVVVLKSNDSAPDWTEISRVQPNTADWSNWKEVLVNINDNSAGLKIRFVFEKTITTTGALYMDDVLIQPFGYTSVDKVSENNTFVYVVNNELRFKTAEALNYSIYNLSGIRVKDGNTAMNEIITLRKGIYVVKAGNMSAKIVF